MPLARALSAEGWGLVQPLLTSSYIGYGTSSLEQVPWQSLSMPPFLLWLMPVQVQYSQCCSVQCIGVASGHGTMPPACMHTVRTPGFCA